MLCSTCNKEIEENALVCPHCRAMHAVNRQQLKVGNVQKKHRQTIAESFKSKYFLVYMLALIFVSVVHLGMFLGLAIPIVSELVERKGSIMNIIWQLCWLLCYLAFVFAPLKAMISSIQLYTVKNEDEIPVKMEGLKSMPEFWGEIFKAIRNFFIFLFAVVLIFLTVVLVIAIKGSKEMEEFGAQAGNFGLGGVSNVMNTLAGGLSATAIILFIAVLVVGILVIVLFSQCRGTYRKLNEHFKRISDSYTSGWFQEYMSISVTRLYILGVVFVLLGGATFVWGGSLINGLWSFGGFFLSNGIYLIINGIFLKHTEQEQRKTALEYKMEKAKLDELSKQSNAIQRELLRKAREGQELQLKAEREEKERQQKAALEEEKMRKELEMQEKNNEMMRQMMKTFMESGGIAIAQTQIGAQGKIPDDKDIVVTEEEIK